MIITSSIVAQDYRFEKVNPSLDWPTGTINTIIQDHQGMIWIGTQSGMARYDGQELQRWEHEEGKVDGLPINYTWTLEEDLSQNILIETNLGISCWNRKTGKIKTVSDKQNTHRYSTKYNTDAQQRFWVFTDSTLSYLQPYLQQNTKGEFVQQKSVLEGVSYWKMLSSTQAIYIKKDSIYLVNLSQNWSEKACKLSNELLDKKLVYITALQQNLGYLLSTEDNKFYELDNNFRTKNTTNQVLNKINYGRIHVLFQDSRGLVWICSDYGLWLWDRTVSDVPKLVYEEGRTHRIIEDKDGNLWFGSDHGLFFFNAKQLQFKFYGKSNHPMLGLRPMFGIEKRNSEEYWAAAMGGLFQLNSKKGLPQIDSISFHKYPKNIPLLTSVLKEKDFLWVGSFIGLHKFYPKTAVFETVKLNFRVNNDFEDDIFKLLKTKHSDDIWLGTRGQIYRYQSTKNTVTPLKGVAPNDVHAVLCSDGRFIWSVQQKLLTYNALMDTFSLYPNHLDSALFSNILEITCLHKSTTKPSLWIGTTNGVYCLDLNTKKHQHYHKKHGLSNNRVLAIGEDKQARIWMSTDAGLNCYIPSQDSIFALYEKDGLPAKEFNQMSFYKDSSGCLLFGCMSGLLVFHPDSVFFESSISTVVWTDLQLDYQSKLGNTALNIPYDINLLKELVVPSDYNMLGLRFVAPSYGAGEVKGYAVRLQGYDDNWIYKKSNDRFISYTNLPPGKYILEVKASSNFKNWSAVTTLPIIVLPAYYETWWFFVLCCFLAASFVGTIVYSYARYQYNKKVLELKTQQKIQAERIRISRDLHDNVGANLSQIIMGLDILEYKLYQQKNEQLIDKAKDINETARSGIQQLRDTVWALKKDAISLEEFKQKVGDYLAGFYKISECSTTWTISIEGEKLLSPNTMLNLFRIIQEATNNTLKYANATQQIIKISTTKNKELELLIKDNGKGFVLADFEQAQEHNGLKNMQFRAESLGGKCYIDSILNEGTTIRIILPL